MRDIVRDPGNAARRYSCGDRNPVEGAEDPATPMGASGGSGFSPGSLEVPTSGLSHIFTSVSSSVTTSLGQGLNRCVQIYLKMF